MAKRAVKWLIIASFTIGITTAAWAQDFDLGISLYRLACGVCHGIDGKGNGPLSEPNWIAGIEHAYWHLADIRADPPDVRYRG